MGDYQKELAIHKLEKASEMLDSLISRDSDLVALELKTELDQIMELVKKAKEDVANV